jgi:dihydropteroate synthase
MVGVERTFGRRTFDFSASVAVMAIVNRTPDSFYDGGRTYALDAAVAAAETALAEGADWLDFGGVKAAPGTPVSPDEECRRVVPLIEAVRDRTDAVISVDTFSAEVAARALDAGADVVNDTSALKDPAMAGVVGRAGAGLVLMHNPDPPRTHNPRPVYGDVVADVAAWLMARADEAVAAGIAPDRIVIDPGHDFAKTTAHSLEITRRLGELTGLGYPVMVALSRKDFIGETLVLPPGERLEGSLAALAASVTAGAAIVRVHDVRASVRAARMTEAILGRRAPLAPKRGLD